MEFSSYSEKETITLATDFAKNLKTRDTLCFYGDLGVGKSVFCRAVIRALTDDPAQDVPSPTFTLLQTYDAPCGPVYHFDLYRLEDPEEVWELNWDEALSEGVALIEWPDKAGPYLPKNAIKIRISQISETQRRIEINEK